MPEFLFYESNKKLNLEKKIQIEGYNLSISWMKTTSQCIQIIFLIKKSLLLKKKI